MSSLLIERLNAVSGIAPVNLATGANAGDWVDVSKHQRFAIVFFKGAGTAGDDPTITIKQATDASGTGNKALNFTRLWVKQDTLLSTVGKWTAVTKSASNTYTDDTSAEDQAIWWIEFTYNDLDANNGYKYVQASIDDVGTNAQLGCVLVLLGDPRYAEAPEDQASPID